jgi:hypothetical protein
MSGRRVVIARAVRIDIVDSWQETGTDAAEIARLAV